MRHASSRLTLVLMALLLAVSACNDTNGDPPPEQAVAQSGERPERGMAWVIIGSDTVHAEVADTPELREEGLMYRTELAPGTGMLFVYDQEQPLSFWMRNTFVPLDIAFMSETQRIVDIQQMEPQDEEMTESPEPARFALEVPQGWFAEQGIEPGAQARIVLGR